MTPVPNLEDVIKQLGDRRSSKRRTAAKKLRGAADRSAADALLVALQKEVADRRTWETQYQMIMALASSCPIARPVPLLEWLLTLNLEPMVHLAASDAIVRMSANADSAVVSALDSGSLPRAEGAIRALAMTHGVPNESTIQAVVQYANAPEHQQVRFWVAAASAGWPKPSVRTFLEMCLSDESADTRRAAQAALEGRYLSWNTL